MFWMYVTVYLLLLKNAVTYLVPPLCSFENETKHMPLILETQGRPTSGEKTSEPEPGSIAASIKKLNSTLVEENIFHPDVIPEGSLSLIRIRYRHTQIVTGGEVDCLLVRRSPDFLIWPFEKDCLYTLVVIGPDAPSENHRKHHEYQHWIRGNIPECNLFKGTILTAYVADTPSYSVGLHKIIFLVFRQPSKEPIEFDEEVLPRRPIGMKRVRFNTRNFSKKYNLGLPIAGNYFIMNVRVKIPDVGASALD